MTTNVRRLALVLALWPVLATCNGGTEPPPAGWLALTLTSPNADAGVLVSITGGTVDSVRTTRPQLVSRAVSETEFRLVIGGLVSSGVIAEILVPDVRRATSYTAVVHEAAAPGTYAQRAVTGYSVQIVAQP